MAGDPTKVGLWVNADVYIGAVGVTMPTDTATPLDAGLKAVGLLSGDEGFTESRDEESNSYYAWGGLLVRKQKSKHERKIRFVCLEDNATTFGLVNPGSTRGAADVDGDVTSTIKVPTTSELAIVFELRDGDKIKRRCVKRCTVDEVADITDSESDMAVYDITVALYPESDGTLYTEISNDGTV
ncbi:hypothetical protein HPO96_36985 [Kribbella sandramycini]|uniref:Uncharacterized protein n=1 Tax=Kribbella sandramycini TaxID=60450 RepID=A0A7Y4L7I4_9ACTN|nr:hypothetical protein [Kribbella sandramycini]MBB6564392.1 hypothetical protein [Kribbella sandramycini]NOL45855.1 hypothetical protein [Kribbella sandramycini]